MKTLEPKVEEKDYSDKIKLRSYSVPMDFDGERLIYVHKTIPNKLLETKAEFKVVIYDFKEEKEIILNNMDTMIKLIKLFKKGFLYVLKNKNVHYFDQSTGKDHFLYNHSTTIVNLSTDGTLISSIDKKNKINVYVFDQAMFIINDIGLSTIDSLPKDLQKKRTFEMEYPYFSAVSEKYYCFTTDFGFYVIDFTS